MNIISKFRVGGEVTFPEFTGERIYMQPFLKREGLPREISRWQPTVDAMLEDIETDRPVYLMVDQGEVVAGKTHRRGGVHIDGNWIESSDGHSLSRHSPPLPPRWSTGGWSMGSHSRHSHTLIPEALILASNIGACRFFSGEINDEIGEGGDCSHFDLSGLQVYEAEANRVYIGNVTCLHESMPIIQDCQRTVVRLNVPGVEF